MLKKIRTIILNIDVIIRVCVDLRNAWLQLQLVLVEVYDTFDALRRLPINAKFAVQHTALPAATSTNFTTVIVVDIVTTICVVVLNAKLLSVNLVSSCVGLDAAAVLIFIAP